ncbi:Myc-type, basic helix-loop-helix [Sesbania bispinosa]|nr:Myc-type, basic helix-loop-helix [Sesbania bispinosa]
MEEDDCNLLQQCHPNLLGDEELLSLDIASALHQPLSSESYTSYPPAYTSTDETRPRKHHKTQHLSPSPSPSDSPTSHLLSFDNSNFYGLNFELNPKHNEVVSVSPPPNVPQTQKDSSQDQNFESIINPQDQQGTKRSPAHTQDHIIAERKRREKLSQSLIALAALIPGLKKMDKASVLGDAIKYVKELQERLRLLEEQSKNREVASVVMINKPTLISCDDHSSDDGGNGDEPPLPHVEARVSEKDVLLRIHCQNQKGLLLKILAEVQNLHLFVVNSSVLRFGDAILDITIVAQVHTS